MILRSLRRFTQKGYFDEKYLKLIPLTFTLGNAFCGFFSIIHVLNNNLIMAAYCIIYAGSFDMFDGFFARVLRVTSEFGAELDTLADVISFCLAPAILGYRFHYAQGSCFGLGILIIYLGAGLFRLARFNVLSCQNERAPFFVGLPSTIAACFIAGLVVDSCYLMVTRLHCLTTDFGFGCVMLILSFLMISQVHYPSWRIFSGKLLLQNLTLTFLVFSLGAGFLFQYPALLFMNFAYILAGFFAHLMCYAKCLLISIF